MDHSMTVRHQTELTSREAPIEVDGLDTEETEREAPLEVQEVHDLIRLLVRQVDRGCAAVSALCETDVAREAVLLDIEVDGVRCLLTRLHRSVARWQEMLSPREQEIARMVSQGYPNKTIAAVLDISCWTVATHLRRIFAKLGVSTRAAMVARLMEDGQSRDHSHSPHHSPR